MIMCFFKKDFSSAEAKIRETFHLFAFGVFRKASISAALRVFRTSSRRSQPFLATATPCLMW